MSEIRAYLEEKAALPEKEWLRREPRTTHPGIVAAVREARAAGFFYDDAVEAHAADAIGCPDELRRQLGHEVYVAKGQLRDEEAAAKLALLEADGWRPLDVDELEAGRRYLVRSGTLYVGRDVPDFSGPGEFRAERTPGGKVGLKRKGGRTFVHVPTPWLVKEVV